MVKLRERVGNAEVIVEVRQNLLRTIEGVAAQNHFVFCGDDPVVHVLESRGKHLELAGTKDIQVTRHRWRGREPDFLAARDAGLFLDRHVGHGDEILGNYGS